MSILADLLSNVFERRYRFGLAQRDDRALDTLTRDLVSAAGEVSGQAIARQVLDRYVDWNDDEKCAFFRHLAEDMGVDPSTVIIDHSTEETTKDILDRGFWAGHTVYPQTKLTAERFANIHADFGIERVLLNSSADWGKADPLLVPKTCALLERRGVAREELQKLVWDNPVAFFGAERLDLPAKGEAFNMPVVSSSTLWQVTPGAAMDFPCVLAAATVS